MPKIIVPWAIWFAIIVLAISGVVALSGCAQTFTGLCAIHPYGMTDGGVTILRAHCEAE